MGNIKSKGAVIVCAVAIVLIIVLLVMQGGNKEPANNNVGNNATSNQVNQPVNNTVTEEFVNQQADGTKVNTSEQLKKTKTIDGLEISNIRLIENGGLSEIVAEAKNTTNSTIDELNMVITAVDKNGNTLATLETSVYSVGAGKTTTIHAAITDDIANAYDFTVTKK